MHNNNNLNILSCNCRSLFTKLSHFKIQLYNIKPHLACLCETWLKSTREAYFINYNSIWKHRPGGQQGGGLAFIIRNDVNILSKQLNAYPNGKLETQALTLLIENNLKLAILNIYT